MNTISRFAIALSVLAIGASVAAQPYSQADQERRARNRADVLAKHPEARRQMSAPATASADATGQSVRDPNASFGTKVIRASNGFAERQSAKMRRIGKRVENALPPNPEKKR